MIPCLLFSVNHEKTVYYRQNIILLMQRAIQLDEIIKRQL